jgi:hypothetical protein
MEKKVPATKFRKNRQLGCPACPNLVAGTFFALGMTAVLAAGSGAAPAVLRCDFRGVPGEPGWETGPAGKHPFAGEVAGSPADGHGFTIRAGSLSGPSFPVTALQMYRVSFEARAPRGGHWAVTFLDEAGNEIVSDVYDTIDPSDDWRPRDGIVRAHADATHARIRFQTNYNLSAPEPVSIRDLAVVEASVMEAADWGDAVAAQCRLLHFEPAADRWQRLPKTMARLGDGGQLRIVMLGDSICNDTANSVFEAALARHYPRTRIEVVPSIRGATGCWWFKDSGRVREYVLDRKPDLLIITGISHHFDAEAIRAVIRQVKEGCGCEILVMTGAITPEDYMKRQHLKGKPDRVAEAMAEMEQFTPRLRRICHDEGAEFFDSRAAWDDWMLRSQTPFEYLARDQIHANRRGKEMAGRFLVRYLAPKDVP